MKDKTFIPMSQKNTVKLIYFGFRDPCSQPQVNEKVDNFEAYDYQYVTQTYSSGPRKLI